MMMETNQELRQQFKNFVADFKRFDDIVLIDWHNANERSANHVNYMINEKTGELHISGDLGSASFYCYGKNTWQDISSYFEDLGYFLSKAEASSEEDGGGRNIEHGTGELSARERLKLWAVGIQMILEKYGSEVGKNVS